MCDLTYIIPRESVSLVFLLIQLAQSFTLQTLSVNLFLFVLPLDMFGLEYVAQWYFESWNEPKRKHFDGLNVTIEGLFSVCFT